MPTILERIVSMYDEDIYILIRQEYFLDGIYDFLDLSFSELNFSFLYGF